MEKVFSRPKSLTEKEFHYCPGCGHGVLHRIVAEVMDEFNIREKTVGVASVGCSVFSYEYFNCDMTQAAHGRAPAVATGVKRVLPDSIVFTYQGDGDLAAIGTAETVHAANRGENITVIFVNNAIYGMTGGQMAPTTLLGQRTTTTPYGRNAKNEGYPIRMCELLATLEGAAYIERVTLVTPADIIKTKKAVKKAFETQLNSQGFSIVEVLSPCPQGWGKSPSEAREWIKNEMVKVFPTGIFKDKTKGVGK